MKVRILYPAERLSFEAAQKIIAESRKLTELIGKRGAQIELIPWDGTLAPLSALPTVILVTMNPPRSISEHWVDFVSECRRRGHIILYGHDVFADEVGEGCADNAYHLLYPFFDLIADPHVRQPSMTRDLAS